MLFESTHPGAGTLKISPESIEAASSFSLMLTWTAGTISVISGGCIRFQIPQACTDPQMISPLKPGYCIAYSSKPGVALSLSAIRTGHEKDNAYVTIWGKNIYVNILSGSLDKGDTVTLCYGSQASNGIDVFGFVPDTHAPFFVGHHHCSAAIDPDGSRNASYSGMLRCENCPELIVRSGKAVRELSTKCLRGEASVSFDLHDNPVRINWNRKTKPDRTEDGRYILWGDMHCHSSFSDGIGTPDECYRFARESAALDFCAVTDHVVQMSDEEWERTIEANRDWHEEGRFLTLLGYELNYPGIGDKNIYYPSEEGLLLRDTVWRTNEKIHPHTHVKQWLEQGAIMMSHLHAGGLPGFYIPGFCCLVELYSNWGNCERSGALPTFIPSLRRDFKGQWASDALSLGWKVGFTANSDDHMAMPGWSGWHRVERVYHSGLTAVYAKEPTRESLFVSLRNRQTYATSGKRIILDAHMNGELPGSEIPVDEKAEIDMRVVGTTTIKSIELISKNGIEVLLHPNTAYWFGDLTIQPTDGPYYIRITQKDGHHAWTSPWYVENSTPK